MEINEKDLLDLFTRLLKQLEQAGINQQGCSIKLVYVASGGQHVDKIERQYVTTASDPLSRGQEETPAGVNLPKVLSTQQAMSLWRRAQKAGYVDEQYQPLISRTQSALLADYMAERLGIRAKWKTFEEFWKRNNMRNDYNKAFNQRQSLNFREEIKKVLT